MSASADQDMLQPSCLFPANSGGGGCVAERTPSKRSPKFGGSRRGSIVASRNCGTGSSANIPTFLQLQRHSSNASLSIGSPTLGRKILKSLLRPKELLMDGIHAHQSNCAQKDCRVHFGQRLSSRSSEASLVAVSGVSAGGNCSGARNALRTRGSATDLRALRGAGRGGEPVLQLLLGAQSDATGASDVKSSSVNSFVKRKLSVMTERQNMAQLNV